LEPILNIVLPVFGLVFAGYFVALTPILTPERVKGLTNFVFWVAIPVLLFRTMSEITLPENIDPLIPVAYFAGAWTVFGVMLLVGRFLFGLPLDQAGVMAMGCSFSNLVLMGLPVAILAFGNQGLVAILFVISFHPPIMISIPTIVVEIARGRTGSLRKTIVAVVTTLLRNPIIIGLVAGLLWGATGLDLPKPVGKFADLLKAAGPPTALFAVGASLTQFKIAGDLPQSLTIVVIKLIALPATVWVFSTYVFGLAPIWAAVNTLAASMPVGVNVFLLASAYDTYLARAATAVLVSTGVAVVTVGALLTLLAPAH
jgi:malonate transporter